VTSSAPLSAAQARQLAALRSARAFDSASAATTYTLDYCSPGVLAALASHQLTDSRVIRRAGGSQATGYWLTGKGRQLADECEKGRQ